MPRVKNGWYCKNVFSIVIYNLKNIEKHLILKLISNEITFVSFSEVKENIFG